MSMSHAPRRDSAQNPTRLEGALASPTNFASASAHAFFVVATAAGHSGGSVGSGATEASALATVADADVEGSAVATGSAVTTGARRQAIARGAASASARGEPRRIVTRTLRTRASFSGHL